MRAIYSLILTILILVPSGSLLAKEQKEVSKNNQQFEIIKLELSNKLISEMDKYKTEMNKQFSAELKTHRQYLQVIDNKFYERFTLWLPIFSGVIAFLFAIFLWLVGQTKKEAFESVKLTSESKAISFAQKKVESIIIPDEIVNQAKEITETTINQIKSLKSELVHDVKSELKAAKDEIVSNKQEVIEQAINEAIQEKFSKEFDIMSRLSKLESTVSSLDKRVDEFEKKIKVEALRLAVVKGSESMLNKLSPFSKTIIDVMAKII